MFYVKPSIRFFIFYSVLAKAERILLRNNKIKCYCSKTIKHQYVKLGLKKFLFRNSIEWSVRIISGWVRIYFNIYHRLDGMTWRWLDCQIANNIPGIPWLGVQFYLPSVWVYFDLPVLAVFWCVVALQWLPLRCCWSFILIKILTFIVFVNKVGQKYSTISFHHFPFVFFIWFDNQINEMTFHNLKR